jgi:hypothetical protein
MARKPKTFEGQRFEIMKAFRRGLENGDRMQLILEAPYNRKMGLEIANVDGLIVDVVLTENIEAGLEKEADDEKGQGKFELEEGQS